MQYYHRNESNGFTVAIIPPEANDLLLLLSDPELRVVAQIGVAHLSPGDQYDKKIGRELAAQRIKETELSVEMFIYYSDIDKYFFTLSNDEIRIAVNLKRGHTNVRVFEAEVSR